MQTIYSWLISNRPKSSLTPQGIVIHSTASIDTPAQNIINWFNNPCAQVSAHGIVDKDKYIQCIPYNEVAWHAGSVANHKYIGIEMCEYSSLENFQAVWANTVEVCANICTTYGIKAIIPHSAIKETDHIDPDPYFKRFSGYNMDRLKQDIAAAMAKEEVVTTEDLQELANKIAKVDKNNQILFKYSNNIKNINTQLYPTIASAPSFAREALNNLPIARTSEGDFDPPLTYDTIRAFTIAYNILNKEVKE